MGIQAAEALDYAHPMGVIHRDIKPSNLLVDNEAHLWITDFGLAVTQGTSNLTLSGDLLRTLRYMSPEQASGRRGVLDHRTDIYSLRVTLYELATLQPAFQADDRQSLLKEIEERDPALPRSLDPQLPADLETIILKGMARQPGDRYQLASDLADDLKRFLDDKPILARRITRVSRTWRWIKRNPVLSLLSAAVLALLLVLAIGGPIVAVRPSRLLQEETRLARSLDTQTNVLEQQLYVSDINTAAQALRQGRVDQALDLLHRYEPSEGTDDLRGFEWYYLLRQCRLATPALTLPVASPSWTEGATVRAARFFPDGKRLAVGSWSHNVKIWIWPSCKCSAVCLRLAT